MDCPHCHGEMKNKVIQSASEIYLLDVPAPLGLPRIAKEKTRLTNMRTPSLPAYYCDDCNVIFIKYSK